MRRSPIRKWVYLNRNIRGKKKQPYQVHDDYSIGHRTHPGLLPGVGDVGDLLNHTGWACFACFLFSLVKPKGHDDGGNRGGMGATEELHRPRGGRGESTKGGAQQETARKPTPLRPGSEVKVLHNIVQITIQII